MAKLACTSACVIALVFLVMNLEALLTTILLGFIACAVASILMWDIRWRRQAIHPPSALATR